MFYKKATKIDQIFIVDLTLCSNCQIDGENLVNFCGLLRKHELYQSGRKKKTIFYVLINTNFYYKIFKCYNDFLLSILETYVLKVDLGYIFEF